MIMKNFFGIILLALPFLSFSQITITKSIADTTIYLGPDFNLCTGYIHILDAGPGFDTYIWQDGSDSQTYLVTEAGTYWVHAFIGSTMFADTINIGYWPVPDPNLGNDTLICFGNSLLLEPSTGFIAYLWQDGSSLPFYVVTNEGLYFVLVVDVHGCTGSDSIYVDFTFKTLDLGNDTVICELDTLPLNAGDGYISYEWQDGSTEQYLLVSGSVYGVGWHEFSVTVLDTNNCEYSDTISVLIYEHNGIAETDGKSILLYPDPAKSFINVDFKGFRETTCYFEILNSQGKKVFQDEQLNIVPGCVIRLNVGHLASGAYFLKIRDTHKLYMRKLLILKN